MPEHDPFESRFRRAYRRYLDEVPTQVDALAVARAAATQRRFGFAFRGTVGPARVVVWLVLLAILLAALAASALFIGSERPVLVLACASGTDPDTPGPVDQARPPLDTFPHMAFDSGSGMIVHLAEPTDGGSSQMWTFDVCTNTWSQLRSTPPLHPRPVQPLVYASGSDVTIALDQTATIWVYDLGADRWERRATAPKDQGVMAQDVGRIVYDPVTDTVLARDSSDPTQMWAYDVSTDAWRSYALEGPAPAVSIDLAAYDTTADRIVAWKGTSAPDARKWLFDPGAGTWAASGGRSVESISYLPGAAAFDESSGRTVVSMEGLTVAYDGGLGQHEVLEDLRDPAVDGLAFGPTARVGQTMVYDPLNERLVMYGGIYRVLDENARQDEDGNWEGLRSVKSDDVLAFDPVAREWTVLLEAATVMASP